MRILQVHNFYRQPGGEDRVFAAECDLLERYGHEVIRYTAHNESLAQISRLTAGIRTIWNQNTYDETRDLIRQQRPDVAHAHNTYPLISPAFHHAVAAERIPLVQTLHNYRLICPGATLYRNGHVCEDCLHSMTRWPAIKHACYRESRLATAVAGTMILVHCAAGTWQNKVHTYIALTDFSKQKLLEGGLPGPRIAVKPNFLLTDSGAGDGDGGYAFFAGRLVEEKGICTLLKAWKELSDIPLKVAGDGPLRSFVEERASTLPHVEYLGACEPRAVIELLKRARFLVFPSEWYEGLPMIVIESFACGTPVIASKLGSMVELIEDGVNGRLFEAGSAESLISDARLMFQTSWDMRAKARACYERSYTAERNYELLMNIYRNARRIV